MIYHVWVIDNGLLDDGDCSFGVWMQEAVDVTFVQASFIGRGDTIVGRKLLGGRLLGCLLGRVLCIFGLFEITVHGIYDLWGFWLVFPIDLTFAFRLVVAVV